MLFRSSVPPTMCRLTTIKDSAEVQMVTVKDAPIPDVPDTPQTGGTLPILPLAAGFLGVAAAALMVWRKRGVVKK